MTESIEDAAARVLVEMPFHRACAAMFCVTAQMAGIVLAAIAGGAAAIFAMACAMAGAAWVVNWVWGLVF